LLVCLCDECVGGLSAGAVLTRCWSVCVTSVWGVLSAGAVLTRCWSFCVTSVWGVLSAGAVLTRCWSVCVTSVWGVLSTGGVLTRCWSVCVTSVWVVCRQEPCSPTADKHDAGLRKQSAPVVHQIVQSNNSVVVPAHADVRKTEKGWAQFEEDCQGMQNICHFL